MTKATEQPVDLIHFLKGWHSIQILEPNNLLLASPHVTITAEKNTTSAKKYSQQSEQAFNI